LNLATQEVRGAINDVPWGPGIGRNVLGDPCIALTWLINELSHQGVILRAGEVVTTGTCLPPGPINSGDRVRGNFGMLGEVSMTLT
jgi:2-keto-4-pentenoate hydratase